MRRILLSAGAIAAAIAVAAASHSAQAAALLTIADQNDVFTLTHSTLQLTATGTGTGVNPVSIIQGNGNNDTALITNVTASTLTITQGTGTGDVMQFSPESEVGGVLHFTGTWELSGGASPTTGSFAEVAYEANGLVADLLTWSVTQNADLATITGTFCANLGTPPFSCVVPAGAVIVGRGPNSFGNQDLTATWVTDRAPEPGSLTLLGAGLLAFEMLRRRRKLGVQAPASMR